VKRHATHAILQSVFCDATLRATLAQYFLEDWYIGTALEGRWLLFQNPCGFAVRVFSLDSLSFVDDGDLDFPRYSLTDQGLLEDYELDHTYQIAPASEEVAA